MRKFKNVPISAVKLNDKFLAPRVETCIKVTIPSALEKCRETGRIDAYKLDWKPGKGDCPHVFWDSDVAKVLEGVAYSLAQSPDAELEKYYDELVDLIVSAQQPDGYLNVHFTVADQDKRWKDLMLKHELYCAGHLMEAAVAGFEMLGKRKFLDAMCRFADYIDSLFGEEEGKRPGIPGHQEIELALVKLYRVTGNERYLKLSKYFIDFRGQDPDFFQKENGIGEPPVMKQVHQPVREQTKASGHAVRMMYMLCGMADVGEETGDKSLLDACKTLYNNIVNRQMYITGGIGSNWWHENFTSDYDLPNGSNSYSESCASMALALFARRMAYITGEGAYVDTVERALFNTILAGISLHGDDYFYSNYHEINDNYVPHNSGSKVRQKWFFCSCCPTSYCRFLTQIPQFIWNEDNNGGVYLNIPVANTLDHGDKLIEVSGGYPESGNVKVTVKKAGSYALNIRISGFAKSVKFRLNGVETAVAIQNGYAVFEREWRSGDTIDYEMDMPFLLMRSNSRLTENLGKVAITHGPVVYCCENTDNIADVRNLCIDSETEFVLKDVKGLEKYAMAVECDGYAVEERGEALYDSSPRSLNRCKITAIPYALWQNRGETNMAVWMVEK